MAEYRGSEPSQPGVMRKITSIWGERRSGIWDLEEEAGGRSQDAKKPVPCKGVRKRRRGGGCSRSSGAKANRQTKTARIDGKALMSLRESEKNRRETQGKACEEWRPMR